MDNYRTVSQDQIAARTEAYNRIADAKNEIAKPIQDLLIGQTILACGRPHKSVHTKIQALIDAARAKYKLHYVTCKYTSYTVQLELIASVSYKTGEYSCDYIHDYVYIGDITACKIDVERYPIEEYKHVDAKQATIDLCSIVSIKKQISELQDKISNLYYKTPVIRG